MASVRLNNAADAGELDRLRTLEELLSAFRRAKSLGEVYEAARKSLSAATGAGRTAVLLFDAQGVMRFEAWHGLSSEYREAVTGQTPWPNGTRDAHPIVVPDTLADQTLSPFHNLFVEERVRALAFIPLEGDRGVFGKFALYYAERHTCTETELALANLIAGQLVLAIQSRRAETVEAANLHVAAIVESSNDAIVSKDLNGLVTSWNKGAERLFGYTAAEIIGRPVATLAAPDVLNEMPGILDKIRRGERVEHYETRRRKKNGEIVHVSLTVSPVRDASGRIVGASKIARDITERKRIENERALLLKREQEARKIAELLNSVGPLLATELSLEKLVQSVTNVATELVGAEFGSFFHNVVNEQGESYMLFTLSGVPRQAFEKFPMPRNTALFAPTFSGEGIIRIADVHSDPRYGKNPPYYGMPEGHLPVRSYLAAPVISRSGQVLGGLFFGHSDAGMFSEQHESILAGLAAQSAVAMDNARLFEQAQWAQKELKRSNEELRHANQDLETFAYSASHDLQEPLRTIVITAQFLERRYKSQLTGDAVQLLGTVIGAAQRMESMIRDVLTYATATKHVESPVPATDSNVTLGSVLQSLATLISDSGATVTYDNLPIVAVHENSLAQIFQNLIGNALKYRGSNPPTVHVSAVERAGWWVFSVSDNGIGIDPAFAEQIFGLFKRLHRQEEYAGSGIGLAVCQRIVEQYGGRIWLEKSAEGQGATFCFTLPVQPAAST
ncbi:MAG: PAS domain S-box protein [Acidobacteriaceae bacterium]|nr:PAS domain S-box protein [Acidobacteriaceae bacterium]